MFFPFGHNIILEVDDYTHFSELDELGGLPKSLYWRKLKYPDDLISEQHIEVLVKNSDRDCGSTLSQYDNPIYIANAKQYSQNTASDRIFRLIGYEVYRFGVSELLEKDAEEMIKGFFQQLFKKHNIRLNSF